MATKARYTRAKCINARTTKNRVTKAGFIYVQTI